MFHNQTLADNQTLHHFSVRMLLWLHPTKIQTPCPLAFPLDDATHGSKNPAHLLQPRIGFESISWTQKCEDYADFRA